MPATFGIDCRICRYAVLLILGKHATSSHEGSPASDEDSCEDFLQEEDEDDNDNIDGDDDKDNECYKEKYENKICNLPHPVQRDTQDLLGYVAEK